MAETVTATELRTRKPLQERLRLCADMLHMGERISWGHDQELMRQAADEIDAAKIAIESLQRSVEAEGYQVKVSYDGIFSIRKI